MKTFFLWVVIVVECLVSVIWKMKNVLQLREFFVWNMKMFWVIMVMFMLITDKSLINNERSRKLTEHNPSFTR